VSLAGILQMLHIERKSMVIEVGGPVDYGTLTVVNGELVDAEVGDLMGERAVYELLTWKSPRVTLLDAVPLFRHSIREPLTHVLMEAARREDEACGVAAAPKPDVCVRELPADHAQDWEWLAETLVIGGARAALVLAAPDGHVLASAAEPGTPKDDPAAIATAVALVKGTQALPGAVSDATYRFDGETALVCPLDGGVESWVVAQCAADDSVEMLRSVVRTLAKSRS
jgi:hypothetical protein